MSNDFDPAWEYGHTYDGLPARVICVNAKGEYPVVALVTSSDGSCEFTRFFKLSGESNTSAFMRIHNAPAPKRKFVMWVNCYPGGNGFGNSSRELADAYASPNRIACIRVEFEEGEGL